MKEDTTQRAVLVKKFVDNINEVLIGPLTEFVSKQKKEEKEIHKKWRDSEAAYYDNITELEKLNRMYSKIYKEFEAAVDAIESANPKSKENPKVNQKLNKKIFQYFIKFKEAESEYTRGYYKLREIRIDHIKKLKEYLDAYQEFTERQIKSLKEGFLLHYTRVIENEEKNKKLAEEVKVKLDNTMDSVVEVEQIINANKSEKKDIEQINFIRVKAKYRALNNKFEEVINKKEALENLNIPILKLVDPDEAAIKAASQPLKLVLSSCWNSIEIPSDKMEEFKQIISTPKGRIEFCRVFNYYRSQGLFIIPETSYKLVGDLVILVLDEVDKVNDIDTAFTILILSQTYYAGSSHKRPEKLFLHTHIQKHPIWSKDSFWEKAIETGIKESSDPIKDKETEEEKKHRIQSLILSRLTTIAQSMIQLNHDTESVTKLVIGHAKNCNLSEDLINELNVKCLNVVGRNKINKGWIEM